MDIAEQTRQDRNTGKGFTIARRAVWQAYQQVKANRGAAGIDGQSLAMFEQDLKNNLYRLWNRLSSGSYMPPPVRTVEIPKASGTGMRALGIPTAADRIAQMVVKQRIEPSIEPHFHPDPYGYRPRTSAIDAVRTTRQRCWTHDWAIDLDIQAFFDTIPRDLLLMAVRRHVQDSQDRWCLLYIERWLSAPSELADGTRVPRTMGTPQGGVVSPLLANLFLHYVFDRWMRQYYPHIPFERYADDIVVHCKTEHDAHAVRAAITARMADCGLTVHPDKTKVVYCTDSNRRGAADHEGVTGSFDFLGYGFRPRLSRNRRGTIFTNFSPAISRPAAVKLRARIRGWRLARWTGVSLEELAAKINPVVRGWLQHYGRFHRSALASILAQLERALVRWVQHTYRHLRERPHRATQWLQRIRTQQPHLLAHWQLARWCGV